MLLKHSKVLKKGISHQAALRRQEVKGMNSKDFVSKSHKPTMGASPGHNSVQH